MVLFRGKDNKWYAYRAVDEWGQVVDVLLRDHRETESAKALVRRALRSAGRASDEVITDHPQPSVKASQQTLPPTKHIGTGLHRASGETTKAIERRHVRTRGIAGAPRSDSRRSPPASASWRASTPSERSVADTFGSLSWP